MADQRMIGDILSERRSSLGLSIDRVVNDTKLQRRMVEAFELSDFDSMPPKGYAHASLASYARYLGLNPNEILRVYDDQLYEFQYETSYNAQTARDRGFGLNEAYDRPMQGRPVSSRARSASFERRPQLDRHDSYARAPQNDPRFTARREQDPYRDAYYGAPSSEVMAPRRSRSDARSRSGYAQDHIRSVDRGLYDSGYRRAPRSGSYQGDAGPYQGRSRTMEREQYGYGYPEDRGARQDYAAPSRRGDRDRRQYGGRGEVQIVTLDDGYQGGSGGFGPDAYRYQQRPPQGNQRVSVTEILTGIVDSIRSDSRTLTYLGILLACAVLVGVVAGVSSCARGGETSPGTIPITSVASQGSSTGSLYAGSTTQLASSVNLNALPSDSILSITVNENSPVAPWVEVRVDDVGQAAHIKEPGSSLQYTVTRNAYVLVSDAQAVTITVNGSQVTPTPENNAFVLRLTVVAPEQTA